MYFARVVTADTVGYHGWTIVLDHFPISELRAVVLV